MAHDGAKALAEQPAAAGQDREADHESREGMPDAVFVLAGKQLTAEPGQPYERRG